MNRYSIFETENYEKDLNKLPKKDSQFIRSKATNYIYPLLRNNPHYGANIKKLKDWEPDTWRYRISQYRLFYEIDEEDKLVIITAIEKRKDAYR